MWRGALAVVLLAVVGCGNAPYTATTQGTTTKSTAKQEGTAPANTMKDGGHIPGS
jgi:hypothetical protein